LRNVLWSFNPHETRFGHAIGIPIWQQVGPPDIHAGISVIFKKPYYAGTGSNPYSISVAETEIDFENSYVACSRSLDAYLGVGSNHYICRSYAGVRVRIATSLSESSDRSGPQMTTLESV
jgi:hypothetical protein